MPPLTRGKARELRAEGKNFDDPLVLGNESPKDPPRITRAKRTASGPKIVKASSGGSTGSKVKKSGGRKTNKKSAKKNKSTKANAAGRAQGDGIVTGLSTIPETRTLPAAVQGVGKGFFLPSGAPNTKDEPYVPKYAKSLTRIQHDNRVEELAKGRIGMTGFLPNGLPATGNELYIPGLSSTIARASRGQSSKELSSKGMTNVPQPTVAGIADPGFFPTESPTTGDENMVPGSESDVGGGIQHTSTQEPATESIALLGLDIDIDRMLGGLAPSSEAAAATTEEDEASPSGGTESARTEGQTPEYKSLDSIEAARTGGLEYRHATMPTLTNDIHDIWDHARHANWKFDQQVTYEDDILYTDNGLDHDQEWRIIETLMPAMRLASLWLTRPEYRGFWATVLYAPCTFDEDEEVWRLAEEAVDMTPERCNDMEERLRDVATKNHFIFDRTQKWASTRIVSQDDPLTWRGTVYAPGYVTILDTRFMDAVWPTDRPENGKRWQENTTSSKLRCLFFFAVNLGKQLAELLWMDRCNRETEGEGLGRKPCIFVHDLAHLDLSHAFEELVLGGELNVVKNAGPMCSAGLALRIKEGVVDADAGFEVGIIHMKGIAQHFSAEWWNKPGCGRADSTARLPVVVGKGNVHYTLY
ncbi:MAG: hypothetical protein Q9209_007521 [Squamulea sp. 1 TL-2023]